MVRLTPIELPDHHGLICGFILRPQAPPQPLAWKNVATVFETTIDGTIWLHFNLVDTRARQWIATCDRIPQVARELLLAADPHIHSEVIDDGFVSILGDLHYDFQTGKNSRLGRMDIDANSQGLLRMYVDRQCLISARERPLKTSDRLRLYLLQGDRIETSLDLLVHFLQYLTEMFGDVTTDCAAVIDRMEDQILTGNFHQHMRGDLGQTRRSLASLHRHVKGNRHALVDGLMPYLPDWSQESDVIELRRDLERLDAVAQNLDLVQERARLLQEEMAGQLQETLNRNLYVLSIVTTVFLPITLITGIFGMNVGGIPLAQESFGFWWAIFVMFLTIIATLLLLRKQRLL